MSESTVPEQKPFIADEENIPEFTWFPILMGALLGIVFGASSIYLVLKVGLTVSASIPVAVLSITLFRAISSVTGIRKTTILENNIVQTTGSAGESLAFAVGLIMPTLLLLGFDIDVVRVMTVSVFGGLLGILLMIPLRQAFIVKQHGILTFPEGKACAEVLLAGEKGGATASMVFAGFGLGFAYQFLMQALKLWKEGVSFALYALDAAGKTIGLKGASVSVELSPSLLGVGYIIGPRIASTQVAMNACAKNQVTKQADIVERLFRDDSRLLRSDCCGESFDSLNSIGKASIQRRTINKPRATKVATTTAASPTPHQNSCGLKRISPFKSLPCQSIA